MKPNKQLIDACINAYWNPEFGHLLINHDERMQAVFDVLAAHIRSITPVATGSVTACVTRAYEELGDMLSPGNALSRMQEDGSQGDCQRDHEAGCPQTAV